MTVSIRIEQFSDSQDISFASIIAYHTSCKGVPFTKHRNLVSGDYTLRCVCGFELVLFYGSGALERIVKVAIGAETAQLEPGTYLCTPGGASVCLLTGA